jgi:hypothetical protein
MRFTDAMIEQQWQSTVGDYDVTMLWLRLPESGVPAHWLVLAWIEGGDLALCSFHFAGDEPELTPDQRLWGRRLAERVLRPEYFRRGQMPSVRLRTTRGATLPSFGPNTPS